MDIIARIKHKLAYLQAHDDGDVTDASYERKWQVRERYLYRVHTSHTEDEIAAFEAENQIRLPEDYRRFIMEIGSEGYNPGYDMYSPLNKNRNYMAWEYPERPFPFKDAMSYEDLQRFGEELGVYSRDDENDVVDQIDCLDDGYLWIIYTGCQCWYMLVITGEARGQIWYVDGMTLFAPVVLLDGKLFDANVDPSKAAQAQRVTFTQWYEAWLNEQISIAQDHWQKRGRSVPPLSLDDN